ncbi:MAG: hypothetical protein P3W94_009005, partial [Paracoccus sp. (in: a-proteobacteria)]|nr:hypothetical protein [Paracoccus sp. (in: a-proteobacteria)]
GGIGREAIGAIRILHDISYVQIAAAHADRFGTETQISDEVTMRRLALAPDLGAPSDAGPRPARAFRPNRPQGAKPFKPRAAREEATGPRGYNDKPRGAKPQDGKSRDARPHGGKAKPGGKPAWAKPKPHRKGPKRPD